MFAVYQEHLPPVHLGHVKYSSYPSPHPESPNALPPTDMIQVFANSGFEGEQGTPISVEIGYTAVSNTHANKVRIVVGEHAVGTKAENSTGGRMILRAVAPPYAQAAGASLQHRISSEVDLVVEALDEHDHVLDSMHFGTFKYWEHAPVGPVRSHKKRRAQTIVPAAASDPSTCTFNAKRTTRSRVSATAQRLTPPRSPVARSRQPKTGRVPLSKTTAPTLMRTQGGREGSKAWVDITTPLQNMSQLWSTEDYSTGRVLVRFHREQVGVCLRVSCERISVDDYIESDIVVSCIYREEDSTFYITSIDTIYLLEKLTQQEFLVEEKNRIRRNLQGLHPETVKRSRQGWSDFFQFVMDFPDPKPRNIEKDFKVFNWNTLSTALEKIIAKYTLYNYSPSVYGSQSDHRSAANSPEAYPQHLTPSFGGQQLYAISPDNGYHSPAAESYPSPPPVHHSQQYFMGDVVPPFEHSSSPHSSPFLQYAPLEHSNGHESDSSSAGSYGSPNGYHGMENNMHTFPGYGSPHMDGQDGGALPVMEQHSSYFGYDSTGYPLQQSIYPGDSFTA